MVETQLTLLRIGEFRVDPALDEICRDGITTKLEPRAMRLLVCLAESAGRVVSVEQLLDLVWKDVVVSPDSVYQTVASLRRILGDDAKEPKYIANVMRRGYRLVAPVAAWTEAGPPEPPLPQAASRWAGAPLRTAAAVLTCVVVLGAGFAAWRLSHGNAQVIARPSSARQATAPVGTPAIAVLPFDEFSTEEYDGELAQALAETVRQRLGLSRNILVKARGSSQIFAGRLVDAKTVGRRLGVRYLLRGRVELRKDRLRVMAQLIDAETGDQLQSFNVDRQIADVFELQNEIAGQFSDAIAKQLAGAEPLRVPRTRSTSLDAYLKFLDAQALLRRMTPNDADQAVVILERVIKMDPGFALAYAELARARWLVPILDVGKIDRAAILSLADKALALDPMLGEAYFIRAMAEDDDHKKEEDDLKRASELAPNFAPGYEQYATASYGEFDKLQEALAMMERAILIDPLAAEYLVQKAVYLMMDTHQNLNEEQYYLQAQALEPDFSRVNQSLAIIKWRRGETAEGIKLIERALRAQTKGVFIHDQACAMYLDIGDRQAAQSVAAGLPANSASNILIATYDRNYQKAAAREVDWDTTDGIAETPYWVSLDAAARQNGGIATTLARLRKQFPLKNVTNGTAPSGDYDAALATIGALLRAQGDRAGLSQVLPPLKALLDRNESRSGWAHSYFQLLAGDPDEALALLAIDVRRQHLQTWWILERDPLWADLRSDARFRDIVEFARGQAAQQREILERMRKQGEVPFRSPDNRARVAARTE
jgi:TolB-like protein/DNA-binding winged helix-turn-helix (wHTH) protein/Tfp pilus assembly protein PilF